MPTHNVGGANDVPADDKTTNDMLKSNLARLTTGSGGSLAVVAIKKITERVVSGKLYEIEGTFKVGGKDTECIVHLWSQPWIDEPNEKVKLKAQCGEEEIKAKGDDEAW